MDIITRIQHELKKLGFIGIGFTKPEKPLFYDEFLKWISQKKYGDMKWEVKLYVGGKVFTEEVYASSHRDARETATARNPRAKVIGVNPIVGS